jgi:hypothetical protein
VGRRVADTHQGEGAARRHATSESPPDTIPIPLWRCAACSLTSRARYSSGCAAIRRRAADSRDLASQASRLAPRALRRAREARLRIRSSSRMRQRGRILAAAAVRRQCAFPVVGLAVGGELAVGAHVEGARWLVLTAVGASLACVSNDGRWVVTIRLHLGVHSLGVAGPRGGRNPPRWPLHERPREARGRAVVSGSANGTCWNDGTRGGIQRHSRYAECLLRRDEAGSSGTGETPLSRLRA